MRSQERHSGSLPQNSDTLPLEEGWLPIARTHIYTQTHTQIPSQEGSHRLQFRPDSDIQANSHTDTSRQAHLSLPQTRAQLSCCPGTDAGQMLGGHLTRASSTGGCLGLSVSHPQSQTPHSCILSSNSLQCIQSRQLKKQAASVRRGAKRSEERV